FEVPRHLRQMRHLRKIAVSVVRVGAGERAAGWIVRQAGSAQPVSGLRGVNETGFVVLVLSRPAVPAGRVRGRQQIPDGVIAVTLHVATYGVAVAWQRQ